MIKITLITLGKLKEDYLRSAVTEYSKRLSRYCSFDIVEISPQQLGENPSEREILSALEREAALIEKHIPSGAFTCALCIEGKQMPSEGLARLFEQNMSQGKNMCFIIGSSFGLHDTVKRRADMRLSVSEMTFPHQLFRVMLCEQIYRAFKICEGSRYHK